MRHRPLLSIHCVLIPTALSALPCPKAPPPTVHWLYLSPQRWAAACTILSPCRPPRRRGSTMSVALKEENHPTATAETLASAAAVPATERRWGRRQMMTTPSVASKSITRDRNWAPSKRPSMRRTKKSSNSTRRTAD